MFGAYLRKQSSVCGKPGTPQITVSRKVPLKKKEARISWTSISRKILNVKFNTEGTKENIVCLS